MDDLSHLEIWRASGSGQPPAPTLISSYGGLCSTAASRRREAPSSTVMPEAASAPAAALAAPAPAMRLAPPPTISSSSDTASRPRSRSRSRSGSTSSGNGGTRRRNRRTLPRLSTLSLIVFLVGGFLAVLGGIAWQHMGNLTAAELFELEREGAASIKHAAETVQKQLSLFSSRVARVKDIQKGHVTTLAGLREGLDGLMIALKRAEIKVSALELGSGTEGAELVSKVLQSQAGKKNRCLHYYDIVAMLNMTTAHLDIKQVHAAASDTLFHLETQMAKHHEQVQRMVAEMEERLPSRVSAANETVQNLIRLESEALLHSDAVDMLEEELDELGKVLSSFSSISSFEKFADELEICESSVYNAISDCVRTPDG
jgi:hypothetical protein